MCVSKAGVCGGDGYGMVMPGGSAEEKEGSARFSVAFSFVVGTRRPPIKHYITSYAFPPTDFLNESLHTRPPPTRRHAPGALPGANGHRRCALGGERAAQRNPHSASGNRRPPPPFRPFFRPPRPLVAPFALPQARGRAQPAASGRLTARGVVGAPSWKVCPRPFGAPKP